MNTVKKIAASLAVVVGLSLSGYGPTEAAESVTRVTLRPMSGPGVESKGRLFLLSATLGGKQAISYFLNEEGACKVTVMVADAFNGIDIPAFSTVRFEVAIDAGDTARMDTAEGNSLEFACAGRGEEMTVRQSTLTPPGHPGT